MVKKTHNARSNSVVSSESRIDLFNQKMKTSEKSRINLFNQLIEARKARQQEQRDQIKKIQKKPKKSTVYKQKRIKKTQSYYQNSIFQIQPTPK
uniref:Uncharacterized protein n=1 Tax=Rhizophora mucronata TaxID=61149 RepID=A0A2P2NXF9_RHIMU